MNKRELLLGFSSWLPGLSVMLVITLSSCERNNIDRIYPRVLTLPVINIEQDNGATFTTELSMFNISGVDDLGFVWSLNFDPKIGSAEKFSFGQITAGGRYSANIKTTLRLGLKYYVRAYAIMDDVVIYGNNIIFKSLGSGAPEITAVSPNHGDIGDTITIFGNNFSSKISSNEIKFEDTPATCVYASRDSLKVLVPLDITDRESRISLSVLGNINTASELFELNSHKIFSVRPLKATINSTISLQGENFVKNHTYVSIGGTRRYKATLFNDSVWQVPFPEDAHFGANSVTVSVLGDTLLYEDSILNVTPRIDSIGPADVFIGDTISVYGISILDVKNILLGFNSVKPIFTSDTLVQFVVPTMTNVKYPPLFITVNYDENQYRIEVTELIKMKGPEITGLSNNEGVIGNTISIYGKYFTPSSYVRFGGVSAQIISVNEDTIITKIPDIGNSEVKIEVHSAEQSAFTQENFTLAAPFILNLPNYEIQVGDTLHLEGLFSNETRLNIIEIDDINAPVINSSSTEIECVVPVPDFNRSIHEVKIGVGIKSSIANDGLLIREPVLDSFSPNAIGIQDSIILEGYFPMQNEFSGIIKIGGIKANVMEASENQLMIQMLQLVNFGLHDIVINLGDKQFVFLDKLAVPWSEYFDIAMSSGYSFGFAIEEKIYFGRLLEIYEYNPVTNILSPIGDFPEDLKPEDYRFAFKPFSIGSRGYLGLVTDSIIQLWEYDPTLDEWTKKSSLSMRFRSGYSLVINNKAYVGLGLLPNSMEIEKAIWEYDPVMDQWTRKNDFPGAARYNSETITVDNFGYLFGGINESFDNLTEVWKYESNSDSWIQSGNPPDCAAMGVPFLNDNQIYIGGHGCQSRMWRYNPANDEWLYAPRPSGLINQTITTTSFWAKDAFTIQGKTYLFGYVESGYPSSLTITSQTWIFDSSIIPK